VDRLPTEMWFIKERYFINVGTGERGSNTRKGRSRKLQENCGEGGFKRSGSLEVGRK